MMEGIKNIISLFWQDLINLIHFTNKNEGDDKTIEYSRELDREGIIVIPQYITPAFADSIREQVEAIADRNPRSAKLDNGTQLNYRNQDNPNGPDYGMLDIFFAEKSIPEIADIAQDQLISILKNVTGQEVIPLRGNAYLNRGIKNTRMYHIDNAQPIIYKAFIYLTDVPNTDYGPYSFVKNSHRFSFYTYLNLFKNLFSSQYRSTDMPSYNKNKVMHAIGKKGDLILSSQNGIHRGLPQQDGKKRVALVLSFMIKSKLSYIHKSAKKNIVESKAYASA